MADIPSKNMTSPKLTKKVCYIIEDDEISRDVTVVTAKRLGFEVMEFKNGKKALEQCASNLPDIILVDWYMPEMDGMQFIEELKKIKEQNKSKRCVTIMVSGESKKEKVAQAVFSGADNYILKPIDLDKLRKKLRDCGVL